MAFQEDHRAKFENLLLSVDSKNKNQLKRQSNGGNSIIFTYPPNEELLYLKKLEEINENETYKIIDISKLLVAFIDLDGWQGFESYYREFSDTPHLIFRSDDNSPDLMKLIIDAITEAGANGFIPVLVKTGALYGTGIDNVNIMEHKSVIRLSQPLVIFYPSRIVNEDLLFLNFKRASKYRCTVID